MNHLELSVHAPVPAWIRAFIWPVSTTSLRVILGSLLVAWVPSAHASLFQHLTATDAPSITKNASNGVTAWADKSGNANDAIPKNGTVTHPAGNAFASGRVGLDFGDTRNSLQLLDVAATDSLLDFSGAASGKSGFAVLVAVRVDSLITNDWNDVIGLTSTISQGGFGMRYSQSGVIQAYLGGTTFQRPGSDLEVAAGDSVILGFNYDATTGTVQLWDSLNDSLATWTKVSGNFSTGGDGTLRLGEMATTTRFLKGSAGEVRIYDSVLTTNEFSAARSAMVTTWVTPPGPQPLQHLDASVPGSVVGSPVSQWTDQSGNLYHASAGSGTVTYPASPLFPVGLAGVDFGPASNSLQLMNAATAASVLDFSGTASANSGFSILLSVRVNQLAPGDWNDLIGITSTANAGGFALRYSNTGGIQSYMGGSSFQRPGSDREITAGLSVVFAFNYDATSGVATLWDSLNNTEATWNVTVGNFAGDTLKLGRLTNSSRYIDGSVGEVKIFAQKLNTAVFNAERDAMTLKWLGGRPVMPVMPTKPSWTITQLLNWNPATDADAPFNIGTVPLQDRITVPAALKANTNARSGQGGIQALDTYEGNQPQGGNGSIYTFTYWQYLEESVFWGGIGAVNFVPPTGEMIDNAHRNGVPILGTIFFPPLVFGGNYSWVQTFLTKVGNTYPAADKLIQTAEYYGFDGWFFNQETEGGTAADAAAMRDLIHYIRTNSNLRVSWYDSMTEAGNIAWQDQFNTINDWYMRHNYTNGLQDINGVLIADSIFADFSNDATTALPQNSRNLALALGLDPYKIWTGLETEAEDFRTTTAARTKMAKAFPDGQNHLTSVGLYRPRTFSVQIPEQDLFWTGASGDPRNTSATVGTGAWKGVSHNIAARSPINSLPFATDFNIGRGNNFYQDGVITKTGPWWNRALQSILPTWRWIVDSPGTKLSPELWLGDSYRGGSCLRVSGTLNSENQMRLYLTDLPVSSNTRLKIIYKRNGLSGVDSFMQVGVAMAGTPTNFIYYHAGNCEIDGWNETTIDLSAHAGSKIATVGLKFAAGTTLSSYEIRIGGIAIYDASGPTPKAPSNIQELEVASWSGLVSGRVKWDHAPGEHYAYNVYVRLANGSLVFAGSTPNNYFYFEDIAIPGEYDAVVVQTIGLDMAESRFSDDPDPSIQITRLDATTYRLSWPTLPGSILESSSTLQAPDWTPVTGSTILEQNGTSYVDISVSSPAKRFFRLRW